jgi:hypothetical protein
MTERNLSDHVKEHYARQHPRADQLERWLAQHDTATSGPAPRRHVSRGIAAAVALVAVLASALAWRALLVPDWATLAAREVALNHRKHLAPEFEAADYDALRAAMGKLDFVLLAPRELPEPGLRLTGARYCSIQGNLAAQIKLRDARGVEYTLYQTHIKPNADVPAAEREFVIDGVRIRQWRENGLFFALAQSGT